MWIIQIIIASVWWYLSIHLLFREAVVWASVENIPWFQNTFRSPSTLKWERFCRDAGLIALVSGGLLFINLPFGVGVLGVVIALPPMIFLL